MFRNQYIITNYQIDVNLNFQMREFSDLCIHHSAELPMVRAHVNNREIVIIGYIIDPFAPEKNNYEICSDLTRCHDKETFMHHIQNLSGRYVVLYKYGDVEIATSDALGHRQIYYYARGRKIFITSSPKLFLYAMNFTLCANEEKLQIIRSKQFRFNENAWLGDQSIDDRLKKVLPNHYLDLKNFHVCRRRYDVNPDKNETEIRELCGQILKGGIAGAVRRYNVIEPITAGFDSRVLLAASKEYKENIQYYIFKRPEMKHNRPDLEIPPALSKKLGIKFEILYTEPLKSEFIHLYNKEHIVPRLISKTQNIQYHYLKNRNSGKALDVKGNGGEILRCFFGKTPFYLSGEINAKILASVSGYSGNEYFTDRIREWLIEAAGFARDYNMTIQDLFYWEQRMGNWGADHGLEQDIALEEFWPFNNATLLLNGINVKIHRRSWPNYFFFRQLMTDLWPEVLCEPINPKKGLVRTLRYYVNGCVKSNIYHRYWSMQLRENLKACYETCARIVLDG